MATSSITKNFVISGQRQVEMFADAIEASANDQTPSIKVNATFLTDPKDIAKFMQKRKKANAGSKYTVFNIREYLNGNNEELGEDDLRQVLSEFSCEKNPDVERFAKEQSIEFAKKQQSVTYLVFSTEDAELVGYFAITIKPITVNAESFSNTIKKKLARVSELNEQNHTYNMAAYLIAQLGKNYNNGANDRITGEELLGLAIKQLQQLQYLAGGMVVFLETLNEEKLLSFYQGKGFQQFDSRLSESASHEPHELIQLLKILK